MTKRLILGCASTGAKFTPLNHRPTGDALLDRICTGAAVRTAAGDVLAEAEELYRLGVRYYHYHARNPLSREQTTDNAIYQQVSAQIQSAHPDMLLSFGASRNGAEVRQRVEQYGEWERVSQCALPLHLGGAHFVTLQAAVELQLIVEMERQHGAIDAARASHPTFRDLVAAYQPSDNEEHASLHTYSTTNGADYGRTSPKVQFLVYRKAVAERRRLGLLHEIEWVQLERSYAMSRYAVEHPEIQLGDSQQLNITLLFGFSPRLPFPESYDEFRRVVRLARSLEWNLGEPGVPRRRVSITVGAAVLPQHAAQNRRTPDVGPSSGPVCALRRLIAYASRPDSGVDIVRVGMEDTPYAVGDDGALHETDNVGLVRIALRELERHGVEVETDRARVARRVGLDAMRDLAARSQRDATGRYDGPTYLPADARASA